MFSSCLQTQLTSNNAIAAFCILNRRPCPGSIGAHHRKFPFRPQLQSISGVIALSLSQSPTEPAPPPDKDWFMDGRDAAQQLKMEIGIMTSKEEEDDGASDDSENKSEEEDSKATASNAVLESGRAAARELLKDLMDDTKSDQNEVGGQIVNVDDDKTNESPPSDNQSSKDCFDLPSRKSHCMTICFVPPPSATKAWEQLTEARRECKDPGFYRWPPHANILYPFLEPVYNKESGESKEVQRNKFRNEIAVHLSKVAEKCKPFDVKIDSFGTFGGKQRGVLWAYPKSMYGDNENEEEEPLLEIHKLLVEQFPMCDDTQKKGGKFNPHVTISHYANNDDALAAKAKVESRWKPVSFHVPEVYLLERKGDAGQFKIFATIPLGEGSEVEFHDLPMPFHAMPEVEEEWVYDERMAMKNRRKKGNARRRRGRRGRSNERDASQESSPQE